MELITQLKNRGIVNNITNIEKFNQIEIGKKVYIGFDPTAKSLHLGNYMQISLLLRFKNAGYEPIAVLGGATGMIGDPSGKSEERVLQTKEDLEENKLAIRKQLESFNIQVIDNYNFYKDVNVLDFLRTTGKLLNVNYMINKDIVKSRLETGISFTEFTYQLIQGWDFKELYEKEDVRIQCGGSDQWGNITAGIEVIRKTIGDENTAVGITTNLLVDSNGNKFGKSTGGAIWLDKNMCSPYKMYQYFLNVTDEDIERIFMWSSFLSIEEIKNIIEDHKKEPFKRFAQKKLAEEVIKAIHSPKDFDVALKLSDALFKNSDVSSLDKSEIEQLVDSIPTTESDSDDVIELLVKSGACSSNREAREMISNSAITINGILMEEDKVLPKAFDDKFVLIRKGKKNWFLIKR